MTYPTQWSFDLDPVAVRMAFVSPGLGDEPVFATPDAADAVVASFDHSDATPDEVQGLLDVSRKLLRTAIIHYEFAAIAAEKSIQALELAVRTRLGADNKPLFAQLIKRLAAETDLTAEEIDRIDTGRRLRNDLFAHPSRAVAFPLGMATGLMQTSFSLISRLFSL